MSNVLIDKDKLDVLATAIANKSGEPLKLTLAEMVEAVDSIETGGGGGGGGVTVTDEPNATGITCVITSGTSPTPPSPDIPLNTQLIDYTAVTTGYIVDGDTGEETVSQWSCCSDYTLIDPTMTFSYVGYQWYDIVFFTESKQYISKIYMDSDKDSVVNDYAHGTLTPAKIPPTAKYVRINTYPNTGISSTELSLIRTS